MWPFSPREGRSLVLRTIHSNPRVLVEGSQRSYTGRGHRFKDCPPLSSANSGLCANSWKLKWDPCWGREVGLYASWDLGDGVSGAVLCGVRMGGVLNLRYKDLEVGGTTRYVGAFGGEAEP